MASGALAVLREHGLVVPRDLGVVAVDDDYFAQGSIPPLTTVRQPTLEVGRTMADVLIDLVEGRPVERVTILPTAWCRAARSEARASGPRPRRRVCIRCETAHPPC